MQGFPGFITAAIVHHLFSYRSEAFYRGIKICMGKDVPLETEVLILYRLQNVEALPQVM